MRSHSGRRSEAMPAMSTFARGSARCTARAPARSSAAYPDHQARAVQKGRNCGSFHSCHQRIGRCGTRGCARQKAPRCP